MSRVHTTDVGTLIKLDTGVDLSTASNQKIVAKKPTGALVDLVAIVVDTTKLQHTKTALTLAEAGEWELQSYVELPGPQKLSGDAAKLYIYPPLLASS